MNDYCPGAIQSPQPGGGGLDASLPPRAVWHITWDALKPDGTQPQFSAVANYLKNQGYCPTIMWNPFTGYMEQYYPASQSARALAAWNQDGAVNVQVEVFFSPNCVVDGVRYATVADTPLRGFDTLLAWMDGLGIPRVWPMGPPQWQGNSRDSSIWNREGGHYGHCNVPDNTHTDPGPMPSLNRGITPQGTITTAEEDIMASIDDLVNALKRDDVLEEIAKRVHTRPLPYYIDGQDTGQATTVAAMVGNYDSNLLVDRRIIAAELAGLRGALAAATTNPDITPESLTAAFKEAVGEFSITLTAGK